VRGALVFIVLLLAVSTAAIAATEENQKTFIIQENPPVYWYCPIGGSACFWYSLFHDRYNCKEFKRFHGKACDLGDVPTEVEDNCKNLPPDIDVGYCYERFWKKEKQDQLPTSR